MVVLIIFGILSFIIAEKLGSKRNIGFGWSLALCLFASPIIGGLLTLTSKKKGEVANYGVAANTAFLILSLLFLAIGAVLLFNIVSSCIEDNMTDFKKDMLLRSLFVNVGLIAIGSYFMRLIIKKGNC